MKTPLVSVIMRTYNGEKYIADAIDSILRQTLSDFELLIVDDGSTDGSPAIIERYRATDARVRVMRHARNLGRASAWNTGLAAASGRYITSMDDDDRSYPQRLARQVAYLVDNPEIGVVSTCASRFDECGEFSIPDFISPLEHGAIILALFIGDSILDATAMFRRASIVNFAGIDPTWLRAEACELYMRMFVEVRFASMDEVLYAYQIRRRSGRDLARAVASGTESRVFGSALLGLDPLEAMSGYLMRMRYKGRLRLSEYRPARQYARRLIDAIIAKGWAWESDRPSMEAYAARRFEQMTPRRWQMFCHWRRHRFGGVL